MPRAGGPAVARVLEQVTKTAREHGMFSPGDLVLVSVSGGPDSTCLLHALHRLRRLFKIDLAVFHFDHKLRPDSHKDATYVAAQAKRLRLPFHLREAEDRPIKGESVEDWARRRRRHAASSVRAEYRWNWIAEGHTLNDQAETVLLALIRGAGLAGLAGIAPVETMGLERMHGVEPLLEVPREDVLAFNRALGLRPRDDSTNRNTDLLRNAIRLKVLPYMSEATGREVVGPIARTAELLRPVWQEAVAKAVEGAASRTVVRRVDEGFEVEPSFVAKMQATQGRIFVRDAFQHAKVPWTMEAIDAVLDLARGRRGRKRDLPGGVHAVREAEWVRVTRIHPPAG